MLPQKTASKRVLVVDDEPDLVRTIGLRLRSAGYEVIGAMDSTMATHLAMTKRPDVIILDIGLPGDNGHVLSQRWSTHVNTRHVPVICITARTGPEDVSRAERNGAFAYLAKPYEPADLLALVSQAAERGRYHQPMVVRGVMGHERGRRLASSAPSPTLLFRECRL